MTSIFLSFIISGTAASLAGLIFFAASHLWNGFSPPRKYYTYVMLLIISVFPLRLDGISDFTAETVPVASVASDMHGDNSPELIPINSRTEAYIPNVKYEDVIKEAMADSANNGTFSVRSVTESELFKSASIIWCAVAVLLFLFRIFGYLGFKHKIYKSSVETKIDGIEKYCTEKLKIRICDKTDTPFVMGLLRPTLILPHSCSFDESLSFIMSHEKVHIKRRDVLVKWLAFFAECIHFFNPVIYFLVRLSARECEASCDMEAVRDMEKEERRRYVEVIISYATEATSQSNLTTAITGSKKLLAYRISGIKQSAKVSLISKIAFSSVTLLLALAILAVSGRVNGKILRESTALSERISGYSDAEPMKGFVENTESEYILIKDGSGKAVMSIPKAVCEHFPAFKNIEGQTELTFFCGSHGDFLWAFAVSGAGLGGNNVNLCTSTDGGKSWYIDNSRIIHKGVADKAFFVSENDGYIIYSGGRGRGVSKTVDGGKTFSHFFENEYPLPLSQSDALSLLKGQLIIAYTRAYGEYIPKYSDPGSMAGDKERLPYIIENLSIKSEDGEYYRVPVIWDFLIEKETGFIYKFYDGLSKELIYFDPYSTTALAFAG